MKKILTLIIFSLILAGSHASADTIFSFTDTWKDWPGKIYETELSDAHGTPRIEYMNVVMDDESGFLKSVQLAVKGNKNDWQEFNSLFINSYADNKVGATMEDWNFFVHADRGNPSRHNQKGIPWETGIFSVDNDFDYTFASGGNTREGNPNGIHRKDLTKIHDGSDWDVTGKDDELFLWTYSFDPTLIDLSQGFAVAFAPWCANDVIGGEMSAVPEPATMALLGIGLLGLAGIARRRISA